MLLKKERVSCCRLSAVTRDNENSLNFIPFKFSRMFRARSLKEKTKEIIIYADAGHNPCERERVYNVRFPDNPICRKCFRELVETTKSHNYFKFINLFNKGGAWPNILDKNNNAQKFVKMVAKTTIELPKVP